MQFKTKRRIITLIFIILGIILFYEELKFTNNIMETKFLVPVYELLSIVVILYKPWRWGNKDNPEDEKYVKNRSMIDLYLECALIIIWTITYLSLEVYYNSIGIFILSIALIVTIEQNGFYLKCDDCKTSLEYLKKHDKKKFRNALIIWFGLTASIFALLVIS